MKNCNKTIKINNSINSFNPSTYIAKIINVRQNKNLTKIKINTPLLFHRNKFSNSLKVQNLHYNYKNNKIQKILENTDLTNDITIRNNNSAYKTSLSTNNTNSNYYMKRRRQLYKNIKTIDSETTQSRNINKYNGKSLSRTTWSSFSFTEGTNNINPLIKGYDYDHKMKYQNITNENNNNNNNIIINNNELNYNEYNINKLKASGIKYCIDEDGNPMNIIDIALKNKKPIAFIIQKQNNKNILIDLDNKIIIPNIYGDYILSEKPCFVVKKYNVQYPELRVNNLENYNNKNNDNNYISINVNDSNENIKSNNNDNNLVLNREKKNRRKINKSCNLYNYTNLGEGLDKLNAKLENNNKLIENRNNNVISPNNQIKKNTYKLFKNSLKEKKRKYIFVNKLPDNNKSIQLKIKKNDNENFNNSFKKLIQSSNTCKNKDIDKIYFFNDNKKDSISLSDKNKNTKDNNNNTKFFLKNLNKLKKGNNTLKDIKCFTHNEIKNLEFKFERKYKTNMNSTNSTQPCFLTEYKFRKIEETPKDNKDKRKIKKENMTITIKTDNINTTNNIESEYRANTTKKYIMDNLDNLDLQKYKKKRSSYSLNQFMFNSLENNNTNNVATPQNMINTLSAFNHSFISPTTETTSYNTIQNLHIDLEKDKNRIINSNNSKNIKKFNSFKYYLKPKIKSQKVFHKRIKTEDMNRGEKRFRFFKSLRGNNNNTNNVNNNSLRSFYNTESDFSVINCKHILSNSVEKKLNIFNNTNNCICKCPYCHHLFYS